MNVFQDTLRRIAERVEGTQAVSLIGVDGIAIDSYRPGNAPALESVAAELGAFVKSSIRPKTEKTESEAGSVQQLAMVTEGSIAILSRVTEEYYLLLLLSREGNMGRGRFELRKAGLALEKELL
jgi:predicted regulator of Ras-like GTPase activity (Roadblock/LC7/MglB family)